MTDRFDALLGALGQLFGMALHKDRAGGCALQIKKGFIVQLSTNETMDKILIGSKVVEVAPGKFRENVLKDALKYNAGKDPRVGMFAFLEKTNQLVLFQYYPLDIMNGERLASLLGPFIDLAEKYREAILAGRASPP
jgi:hypothetical protein